MASRSPTIIDRADEVDTDLVPEPWDDRDAAEDQEIVTRRERYRLQGVTDGQGAGIVPAYNLNVADTGSIPQKTKEGWTRGSAGRVLNAQGQYVSRGSDVPRKSFDGDEAGLLVEASSRTNHVHNSSNLKDWNSSNVTLTAANSVINGQTAQKANSTSGKFDFVIEDAGTTSGNPETLLFILERGSGGTARIQLKQSGGTKHANLDFDWSSKSLSIDNTSSSATVDQKNFRKLEATGPNGGLLIEIRFTISGVPSGQSRNVVLFPDGSDNQNFLYFHHAQLEEAPNASSPIVTGGSPTTRIGDDYSIFSGGQPSWWNPNEMTILFDFKIRAFQKQNIFSPLNFANAGSVQVKEDSPPYDLAFSGGPKIPNSIPAFQEASVGISLSEGETVVSVNGRSFVNGETKSGSLNSSALFLADLNEGQYNFDTLRFENKALPESMLNRITS